MKRVVNGVEVELHATATVGIAESGGVLLIRFQNRCCTALVRRDGPRALVSFNGRTFSVERVESRARALASASSGHIIAPMPGLVVDVSVAIGDTVMKGDKLLTLEAMKTQLSFSAPFLGKVVNIGQKGAQVQEGTLLASLEESS